ncbi:MAG: hypothetical protein M3177_06350, partial [Pseudomonadota bacterium]|nr:hypothetical protein [Pseudomonadota bacterium]
MTSAFQHQGRGWRLRHTFFLPALAWAAVSATALPEPAVAQIAAAELQSAVRSAVRRDREIARFYQARRYQPLWVRNGTVGGEARQLLHLLETADADGLDPRTYRPDAVAAAIANAERGRRRDLARAEILLSTTFANYVRDVRRARDMGVIYTEAHYRPSVPTRTEALEMAASAPDLQTYL